MGSAPKPGWVQLSMRFSTPSPLIALARIHSPRVIASHSAALGWVHGASTAISAAMLSIRVSSRAASGRIVGSGGTVPEYSIRPVSDEM